MLRLPDTFDRWRILFKLWFLSHNKGLSVIFSVIFKRKKEKMEKSKCWRRNDGHETIVTPKEKWSTRICFTIIVLKSSKIGATQPLSLHLVYDCLSFTLCPQLDKFLETFLWPTYKENHSAVNTHIQRVVRTANFVFILKSVETTTVLGGLLAILIARKETSTPIAKRHTSLTVYFVMIWSVLPVSKKN